LFSIRWLHRAKFKKDVFFFINFCAHFFTMSSRQNLNKFCWLVRSITYSIYATNKLFIYI
jgi:hypothetical protein